MSPLLLLLVVFGTASVASAADAVRGYPSPLVVQKQFELPSPPPIQILPSQPPLQVERASPRPSYPLRPLDHLTPR